MLTVRDIASVVSLCDAMLADVHQLLLYRANLAACSSIKCSVESFSELVSSLELLRCFTDRRLFRHKAVWIKREQFLLAPKQKYKAEFSMTVDFCIAGRIDVEISERKLVLSWDCPTETKTAAATARSACRRSGSATRRLF
jgi:hypothetical protein